MKAEPRFVFDTNVIISALLFNDSTPGRALFRGIDEGEVLLSQELLEQITQVLMREKFDTYLARRTRAVNSRPSSGCDATCAVVFSSGLSRSD